jgi:cell division protein FtsX
LVIELWDSEDLGVDMIWIERQRAFLDFTLSSLWRRKVRNLSLLMIYALIIFLLSSVIFFTHALRKEAESVLKDSPEMIVQRVVGGRHSLIPISYVEKIDQIRGTSSVRPRLWGYYFHPASKTNYTIMVPEEFSQPDDTVETGAGVLRTWGPLWKGKLYFKTHDGEAIFLKAINTMGDETDLVSADLILMSESTFRKISGIPEGYANDLSVNIRNERESQTIMMKTVKALPDTRPILKKEIIRTYISLFDWRGGYVIVLLWGALLAFFIFAWDKATGLSAEEKTEIGILKGIGWDTSDVLMMKFWEGVVISLSAFLLGVIAAYVHVYFASATFFEHALKGWSILYPKFSLRPSVNPYQLAILFFLTVVPYTLLTIVPTWKVAITEPDLVMRH